MKIAYITAYTPFGRKESFVLEEMLAITELGIELVIVPRNPPKEVFHKESRNLLNLAIWLPLLNWEIFSSFLWALFLRSRLWHVLWMMIRHSRSLKIFVKNLIVIPKAVFIAPLLKQEGVEHIHAHWGSTTATMALVASELMDIPWSLTIHRWDITENNMLKLKVKQATFVRCISDNGRHEVLKIVGEVYKEKVIILHLGVRISEILSVKFRKIYTDFVIACPANFVTVKGHYFLIEACALLVKRGVKNIKCLLIGDGVLKTEIQRQIEKHGLYKIVTLLGYLPHINLMRMYERNEVNAVVLPSIVTPEGEKEGIPVVLMEAMAYGIPVVSTMTGGIPELLQNGAGLLVPSASIEALADAVLQIVHDKKLWCEITQKGHERVRSEFNLHSNVQQLLNLIVRLGSRRIYAEKKIKNLS